VGAVACNGYATGSQEDELVFHIPESMMTRLVLQPRPWPVARRLLAHLVLVGTGALLVASLAQATALDAQLLLNGDAELGSTAGWASTGVETVTTATSGVDGLPMGMSVGAFSFTGGPGSASSQSLSQIVGLQDVADLVDTQHLAVSFSLLLQSRRNPDTFDTARATLRFLDGNGATLSELGFVDDSIPLNVNDWTFASAAQIVPNGARAIQVLLDATRQGGVSSDGFFDNVHLSVSAVPEPPAIGLMAAGLLAVALARRFRPHAEAQRTVRHTGRHRPLV
jgi:hypothetical protein